MFNRRGGAASMLFNSYVFLLGFFPAVTIIFFVLGRSSPKLAASWLAIVSIVFYGWWDVRYVPLLLISIVFNFSIGKEIDRNLESEKRRRLLLTLGVMTNLTILLYFKYLNFFIDTATYLIGAKWHIANIALPLGISFFTFTQIAFLVDVSRGLAREPNFTHYVLFVSYFPHLIAGPVLHHKQMMPQFADRRVYIPSWHNFSSGLMYFSLGLSKKVLIADTFAEYATPIFSLAEQGERLSFFTAWIGALAYSFQLYFDFSGYSDMAVGLARMLGVDLPINFNSPYKSSSIIEFWQRWHMTLSKFLRDYLYIPLGGNRLGAFRRYINLLATMVLGGLWHGASWTFVVWGTLHGIFLIINHAWRHYWASTRSTTTSNVLGTGLTFILVVVAWVFFRAKNVDAAISMVGGMFGLNGISFPASLQFLGSYCPHLPIRIFGGLTPELSIPVSAGMLVPLVVLPVAFVMTAPNTQELVEMAQKDQPLLKFSLAAFSGVLFAVSVLSFAKVSEFLYFQF